MDLPKARTSEIIEQETNNELLIYDLRNNKAYSLNETSKTVYKACSNQTFSELKRLHKFTDDLIYLALDELSANNLLEEEYKSNNFAGLSRREVIRKVGLATMVALPVIAAIAAPSAAAGASLTPCQRTNCRDGQAHPSGGCNPPTGCQSIGFICCAFPGDVCNCSTVNSCIANGGQICQ